MKLGDACNLSEYAQAMEIEGVYLVLVLTFMSLFIDLQILSVQVPQSLQEKTQPSQSQMD